MHNMYPPPPPYYNFNYGPPQPNTPWPPQSKRGIRKALREYQDMVKFLEEVKKGGEKKDDKKKQPPFGLVLAAVWFASPIITLAQAGILLWILRSLH